MIELVRAAAEIQAFLQERKWRFCFIGGFALLRWGEPRFTQDVDLTLYTGFMNEEDYVKAILSRFSPRIDGLEEFALKHRVLLVKSSGGIPLDISLGGLAVEEKMVERSTLFVFAEGYELRTCSAEDLVILKSFADRARDWGDVETVLIRQAGRMDWEYIRSNLDPLCELKEKSQIPRRLDDLKRKVDALGDE
jgi:predicted nucleotidyltransferase